MGTVGVFTTEERLIMQEAFTVGRMYSRMGESESPAEIQTKLERLCAAAIGSTMDKPKPDYDRVVLAVEEEI